MIFTLFQALSTVSYIGCGISIFSLLLTMFAIVYWRYVIISIGTGTDPEINQGEWLRGLGFRLGLSYVYCEHYHA